MATSSVHSTSPEADATGRRGPVFDAWRIGAALAWTALIAVAARLEFPLPGTDIPQTAQTVAVLLAGAFLGFAGGTFTVVAYLVAGAVGLPVFAGGASGVGTLLGPSGGYLLGFWFAAALTGYLSDRGVLTRLLPATAAMLGAHAMILGVGATLLAARVGFVAAWFNGVAPFLLGGLIKSVVAAAVVVGVARLRGKAEASQ